MKFNLIIGLAFVPILLFGQERQDSNKHKTLDAITIKAYRQAQIVSKLEEVHQTYIIGGRKSEVINVVDLPANLAEKL
ncbi:MAG: hypothetical protein M3Q56_12400 [Bacteroidota bacterium]|nr:hypothetical protein [Bacteroidota bacterium]